MATIKEAENPFAEEDNDVDFWEEGAEEDEEVFADTKDTPFADSSDEDEEVFADTSEDDESLYDFDDESTPARVKIFEQGDTIDYFAEGLAEPPYWSWSDEDGNWEVGTRFTGVIVRAKKVPASHFKYKTAPVKRARFGVIYTVSTQEKIANPKGVKAQEWLVTNASPAHISYAFFKLLPQPGEFIQITYKGLGKATQGAPPRLFEVKVGRKGEKPRVWSSASDMSGQAGGVFKERKKRAI